jgi:hypothetical protein
MGVAATANRPRPGRGSPSKQARRPLLVSGRRSAAVVAGDGSDKPAPRPRPRVLTASEGLRMVPLCVKSRDVAEGRGSPELRDGRGTIAGCHWSRSWMARPSGRGGVESDEDMVASEIGLSHPRWRGTPVRVRWGALYAMRRWRWSVTATRGPGRSGAARRAAGQKGSLHVKARSSWESLLDQVKAGPRGRRGHGGHQRLASPFAPSDRRPPGPARWFRRPSQPASMRQ